MAYDRAAFLARFLGGLAADQAEAAARHAEYDRQREAWRQATGHPLAKATSSTPAYPAPATPPVPPRFAPIPVSPPTATELAFARVQKETSARIERERQTRQDEKAAVALILNAYHSFEPADRASARPHRGTDAEEAAVALILSFTPKP